MKEVSPEQQLKNLAINGLDDIVLNVKKATKAWTQSRIPLNLIDKVFTEAKIKKHSTNSAMEKWRNDYNKTLVAINTILHKTSLNVGDEKITLEQLILVINHVKSNM